MRTAQTQAVSTRGARSPSQHLSVSSVEASTRLCSCFSPIGKNSLRVQTESLTTDAEVSIFHRGFATCLYILYPLCRDLLKMLGNDTRLSISWFCIVCYI